MVNQEVLVVEEQEEYLVILHS
jgi:hypothetical protein